MRILIACEMSGRVRDAFIALGHDATSCDVLPSLTPGPHIVGDVLPLLAEPWDMVIAFPPCTDLSVIGAKYWAEKKADGRQEAAVAFVDALWNANAPRVAIENPVGYLNRNWRKPDQIINPWMFGDPWRKRTCLWLRGLPTLTPTDVVEPVGHWVDGGTRVKRNTFAVPRQFADEKFGSGDEAVRKAQRSMTFPGVAAAMAGQWTDMEREEP